MVEAVAIAETQAGFLNDLRAASRAFWMGVIDMPGFYSAFAAALDVHLRQAWVAGARDAGIEPDEMTPAERTEMKLFIVNQKLYIGGVADFVFRLQKSKGGKLATVFGRLEVWANRWNDAYHRALAMAGSDEKREWELGRTKKHCYSCAGLNGRVYRMSVWSANNALPGGSGLKCKGFN